MNLLLIKSINPKKYYRKSAEVFPKSFLLALSHSMFEKYLRSLVLLIDCFVRFYKFHPKNCIVGTCDIVTADLPVFRGVSCLKLLRPGVRKFNDSSFLSLHFDSKALKCERANWQCNREYKK